MEVLQMVSKMGEKEFRKRVKTILFKIDGNIKEDDLYFLQTQTGYCIEYKLKYPNRSDAGFIVYQDLVGCISVHGNMTSLIPIINNYKDMDDFEQAMLINRCIKCNRMIDDEYFEGVNGKICVNCIKELYIYHGLKSLGMIRRI